MDYLGNLQHLDSVTKNIYLNGVWGPVHMCRCTIKYEEEREMSNITVTQSRIEHLMETAEIEAWTVFDKCTVVVAKLENGFILVESSACVDPANYDPELGEDICRAKIKERLWELEGYALQKAVHKLTQEV